MIKKKNAASSPLSPPPGLGQPSQPQPQMVIPQSLAMTVVNNMAAVSAPSLIHQQARQYSMIGALPFNYICFLFLLLKV